ncbi:MAG: monooxygenase [Planctomycetes bacterium]|nr:monooxygenase [Planctomycetota bacterium]
MAVDTPARVAILGAGPVGLEAALYARYLGYDVDLYDRGRAADHVRRWGHVRMFSPFHMNCSTLGLAALKAQDAGYQPPGDEKLLTGREWVERYLEPLARSDLVADHLREATTVKAVGRDWLTKMELPGEEERGDEMFRLLVSDAAGERIEFADVVIDASGVYGNPNWLGQGGLPAIGECDARPHIEYELPDVLGADRERYAGKRILVAGAGYSAATTVCSLAELTRQAPGTDVVWITRRPAEGGPVSLIADDRLPERNRLAAAANELASGGSQFIQHVAGAAVDRVRYDPEADRFHVALGFHDDAADEQSFDRIIANVGYRPCLDVCRELQVHVCYATEGPMKLAAALLGKSSADCLDQPATGPQTLVSPEPNFYILGAKSYGRNSRFLFRNGLEQIRELFTIIGDRKMLNLYETAKTLL